MDRAKSSTANPQNHIISSSSQRNYRQFSNVNKHNIYKLTSTNN